MKILRIADVPNNRTGGMSRAMYSSGDAMIAAGHDVSYLFSEDLPVSGGGLRRLFTLTLRLPGVIHRLAASNGGYDVVEIHEPLAVGTCLRRKFSRQLPPIAIFSHGLEERAFAAHKAYLKSRGMSPSAKENISTTIRLKHTKYSVRHAEHVLCCSAQDVEHLKQHGVRASRLTRHFNGVETEFLEMGRQALAKRTLPAPQQASILFLGNWLDRKGILDLIPALHEVMRARPGIAFTAAGFGGDPQRVLNAFEPDVRPRVRAIPRIEGNAALAEVYAGHDIFVLPSYFEGHPLVMIEAAAFGLPLITTNVCGMADFVRQGENGLTVPVGDPAALAHAISRLVDDPSLICNLGKAAFQTANEHSWPQAAANMVKGYQRAVDA